MKKFSLAWNASRSKRKQRKFRFTSPLHIKHKLMNAQLSEDLRSKMKTKSLPVRSGDEVRVMRGKFRGKTGKVKNIQLKKTRLHIEKLQTQKKDGTKLDVWFHPSNLQIIAMNTEDKMRTKNAVEVKKEIKSEVKQEKKK